MGLLITNQDVIDLVGQDMVDNFTDDGSEISFLNSVIQDAEAWVLGNLVYKYTAATLKQSPQVKMAAKYYAAYLLTTRRGGVFYYGEAFDDMKQYIQDVRESKVELSDENGNLLRQDASDHLQISMQNLVVDERYPGNRIRTIETSSERTISENSFTNDGVTFFGY
jgi:hypothetical protein